MYMQYLTTQYVHRAQQHN